MVVCEKKIDRLVQKMHEYYSSKDYNTLATVDFPPEIKYKSNEWLIYIFYSCLLDYGMRSQNYHNNLINTYHVYPQIFNQKYVIENFTTNKEELLSIMKNNIHPRYPNVAVDKWINLSVELSKYDNLLDKIKKFNSQMLNSKQIEELSSLYIESGEKIGIDANLVDKYLWNIGNDFCNKKNCIKCPLFDDCKTKID